MATKIQFKDSLLHYNLPDGYADYFYKETGTIEGTLELCCRCFDDISEEDRATYERTEKDPYGMIDFVRGTEYGEYYACGLIAQKLNEGYGSVKDCAIMHYWGQRFVLVNEMYGCTVYLSYLYKFKITDRRMLTCCRKMVQYGSEQDAEIAAVVAQALNITSDYRVDTKKLAENPEEKNLVAALQTAKENNEFENYIFLYALKKWAGYAIDSNERGACRDCCEKMGVPHVYDIIEGVQNNHDIDLIEEQSILSACILLENYSEWKEFWMSLLYLFISKYRDGDFTQNIYFIKVIAARNAYKENLRDLAIAVILKYLYSRDHNKSHSKENAEKNYNQIFVQAKSMGFDKNFPKLDIMPSAEDLEECFFYGKLGSLFAANCRSSHVKGVKSLRQLTLDPNVDDLKVALRLAFDENNYGRYFYLSYLLAKQKQLIDTNELMQVCNAAQLPMLASYQTLQNKTVPQYSLNCQGVSAEQQFLARRILSFASQSGEDFEEWKEFWARVFYEFCGEELDGYFYPFADYVMSVFVDRNNKCEGKDDNILKGIFALLRYCIETSANIGEMDINKEYRELLKGLQLKLLANTGNVLFDTSAQERSASVYRVIFADDVDLEIGKRIGTIAKKEGEEYTATLEFEHCDKNDGKTFSYSQKLSFEEESDVGNAEFGNIRVCRASNAIKRGLMLVNSDTHTNILMEGDLSLDGRRKKVSIDGIVSIPYNEIENNGCFVQIFVKSFERVAKYIVLDIIVTFTLGEEDVEIVTSTDVVTHQDVEESVADNISANVDDLAEFVIENGVLKKYNGAAESVVTPSGVTEIGENCFRDCASLTNIVVSDGVVSIDDRAFSRCENLANVVFPQTLRSIGTQAFLGCKKLKSLTIPDGVRNIGEWAFSVCNELKEVVIPGTAIKIETEAFSCCKGLERVVVQEGVETIGWKVFAYCSNLTSVVLPQSIKSFGKDVFSGTPYLEHFEKSKDGTLYFDYILVNADVSGNFVVKDGTRVIADCAFDGCANVTEITLPESVISVGSSAFRGCKKLQNIVAPKGIPCVGYQTFRGCESLTNVMLTKRVAFIGANTFLDCKKLEYVAIPDGVVNIEVDAFDNCQSLRYVILPQSLRRIYFGAFSKCRSLDTIYYMGSAEEFKSIKIDEVCNQKIKRAKRYFYCESQPVMQGNFWHYVDGAPTKW